MLSLQHLKVMPCECERVGVMCLQSSASVVKEDLHRA